MTDKWIIDVLTDLRTFAKSNDLPALAEYLDDAKVVAASEIALKSGGPSKAAHSDATLKVGKLSREIGTSDIA